MTNSTALGYMILAAKAVGLDKQVIRKLEQEMVWQMDMVTEDRAASEYRAF